MNANEARNAILAIRQDLDVLRKNPIDEQTVVIARELRDRLAEVRSEVFGNLPRLDTEKNIHVPNLQRITSRIVVEPHEKPMIAPFRFSNESRVRRALSEIDEQCTIFLLELSWRNSSNE